MSEEALQITEERREVKGKGERERYPTECTIPRIEKRDKGAFLSEQCKEIEEKIRIRNTRDLFKKTGDSSEHFMQEWAL